jgi:hypothetical protein
MVKGRFAVGVLLAHPHDGAPGLVSFPKYADLRRGRVFFAFQDLGLFGIPRLTLSMAQFS